MAKFSFIVLLIYSTNTFASELIYNPYNPSFGGFSGNGTILLNQANAENDFKDPEEQIHGKKTLEYLEDYLKKNTNVLGKSRKITDRSCVC